MSKTTELVIAMQEDAIEMDRAEFIAAHGKEAVWIWEVQNGEMEHPGYDEYKEAEAGFFN